MGAFQRHIVTTVEKIFPRLAETDTTNNVVNLLSEQRLADGGYTSPKLRA